MSKDAYFFSHDSNARTDPKILDMLADYKAAGYGLYWTIIEMLRESDGYKLKRHKSIYKAISMQMLCERIAVEEFINASICEYELFAADEHYFWSESLLRRMQLKEQKSEKARRSARARWDKKPSDSADSEEQPPEKQK